MPANGMLYTFPIDCQRQTCLIGAMGFGSESNKPPPSTATEQLEKGPALGHVNGPASAENDGPVYRANLKRQGSTVG